MKQSIQLMLLNAASVAGFSMRSTSHVSLTSLTSTFPSSTINKQQQTIQASTKLNLSQRPSDETRTNNEGVASFNPFNFASDDWSNTHADSTGTSTVSNDKTRAVGPIASAAALGALVSTTFIESANAAYSFNAGEFNPDNFRPVCSNSDTLYRYAQGAAQALVGQENFVEYGPLIAGGLLRIRLELCVVESFFNEAVGPFIEKEGLGWILPLHETVETFIAGSTFAIVSTFILVGSTKILSVLYTYADVFFGVPLRWIGGYTYDRARGKPVTFDIGFGPFKTRVIGPGNPKDDPYREETLDELLDFSKIENKDIPAALLTGAVKTTGETSRVIKETLENIDLFVGRYLTTMATGYVGLKFLHFKVFPDFPDNLLAEGVNMPTFTMISIF